MKTVVGAREQTGTRERVLALLLEHGPSTSAALAARLQVSPAGVRRHLDALLTEGSVTTTSPRVAPAVRGRGRPARLWALSDAGHAAGPSAYDDLAAQALRFLAEQAGPSAVEAFATARIGELEARYRAAVQALPPAERPAALAAALTADGYAATTTPATPTTRATRAPAHAAAAPGGVQLCQHHCPVRAVAEQFPQLCEAETAAIGRLLGGHVQRLATIAHGDGVCTTHIPASHLTAASTPPGPTAPRPTPAIPAPLEAQA